MEPFRLKASPAELLAWSGVVSMELTDLETNIEGWHWALRLSDTGANKQLTLMRIAQSLPAGVTRRCILPVTGFVGERCLPHGERKPILFSRSSKTIFGLAAAYQQASDGARAQLSVLHTNPNVLLAGFFRAQPVVVQPQEIERWLNPSLDRDDVADVVRPLSAVELKHWMALPADTMPSCSRPQT